MFMIVRVARLVVLPTILLMAAASASAQAPLAGVSLKVSREVAPPGAISQMKVFVTEPKPITTGYAWMDFDGFSDIEGIALGSEDSAGIAVVRGGRIVLTVSSPNASFGMDPDYPVLTVAGRVPATSPVGVRIPMTVDPAALQLTDPSGALYLAEVKDGFLLSGGTLSIGDVVPGSGTVEAGGVVSIFGTGFRPDTRVRLKETVLTAVRYVSPTRIDVILADPTRMQGVAVRATNRDGAGVTYFSYQRTRRSGATTHPVLREVVPIFAEATSEKHAIDVSAATAGIALQNRDTTRTFVLAELSDASGLPVAAGFIEIPSRSFVVRSIEEIFGWKPGTPGVVTLVGVTAVQAMGVDVDAQGRATPRLAR